MRLYAVQHNIIWEDKPANYAKTSALLAAVRPQPGSLIVLPEMFATGFTNNLQATKESKGETTEQFLKDVAATYQSVVVGGLVGCGAGEKGRNEAVVIAPDGSELARYAKMHPFSFSEEQSVHEAGAEVVCFDYQGLKIAPLICYDLRFPERAREAVAKGAEVLIYIASWPIKRTQHWVTLLQARAIENQAWVVGVNRCGTDPQFTYPGRSMVIDPHGVIVADAADREGVLEATIDRDVCVQWRAEFPALRDRR